MLNRIVSTCSLLFILSSFAFTTDYVGLRTSVIACDNQAALKNRLQPFTPEDSALAAIYNELPADPALSTPEGLKTEKAAVLAIVDQRIAAQRAMQSVSAGDSLAKEAKSIKASPLYHDPGVKPSANWLSRALARIADLFKFNLPQDNRKAAKTPDVSPLGPIFILLVIAVLIALVGLFVYYVAQHFSWQSKLRRKASALLEDDEPERTADEWLTLADSLTKSGRYREAVRCLYLACLLRFDEAGVARFIRSETNWEHLARIQGSPYRPPDIEFQSATQNFDRVWYGKQVRGLEDVDQFRIWYGQVMMALHKVAA